MLDKILQENAELNKTVARCTAEKTSLEKQLKQLQKEKDDLQNKNAKIQQRNENISKLKKLLGEQKDEIDSLLTQKEKIKKSLEQKHLMQTSVLEKQVQDLSQNIAVLTKEAHQKNAEACEMKGSLKTSQDENKRLQIENEALKGANSTLASSTFSALGSIMDGIDQAFLWSDPEETESDPNQDSPSSEKQENLQESLLIQIFQLLAKEAHLVFVQTLASYLNIPFKSHLRPFLGTFHTKEIRARIFALQNVQEQISIFKENQPDNAFGLKNYLKGLDDAQHLFKSYSGFIQQYQDILYRQGFLEEEDT